MSVQTRVASQDLTDIQHPTVNTLGFFADGSDPWAANFERADAQPGPILVSKGVYAVERDITITSPLYSQEGAVIRPKAGVRVTIARLEFANASLFDVSNGGLFTIQSGIELEPEFFGAAGDGITNDSAAFNALLASISTNMTARFRKSYKVSNAATQTVTGKNINLKFDPNAIIDVSGSTATPVLMLTGSVGAFTLLGADAVEGVRTLTLDAALAATLAEGDLLRLTTDPAAGGSGELWSAGVYKGEICEVLSVAGAVATLKNAVCDSYTAANTVAARIAPITGRIEKLRLNGDVSHSIVGVNVQYAKNISIVGGNLTGFGYTCLQLSYCYNVEVDGYKASNFYLAAPVTNYGLMIASCQNVSVHDCDISGGRHAITTGGWEPNRYIEIGPNNRLDNDTRSAVACLGLHSNVDRIKIFENIAKNSIQTGGRHCEVVNNDIFCGKTSQWGINHLPTDSDDYFRAIGNRIYAPPAITQVAGVYINMQNGVTFKEIEIRGNDIAGDGVAVQVICGANVVSVINTLRILDNVLRMTRTVGGYSIYLNGFSAAQQLQIDTCEIRGNEMRCTAGSIVYVYKVKGSDFIVDNNQFYYDGAVPGSYPLNLSDVASVNLTRVKVRNNLTRNTTDMNSFFVNCNAAYCEFTGNTLDNFSAVGGVRLTATDVLYRDNVQVACTGNISISGRAFKESYGNANVTAFGTAAPVAGTWKVGDRLINTSPAVGQPKAWSCTVAGTPGTWVSEGNL